jgi:hypothetical protein
MTDKEGATPPIADPNAPSISEFAKVADMWNDLREEMQDRSRKYNQYTSSQEYAEDLRRAYESLADVERFAPGDLVQWKTFMRDQEYPAYGSPAIVLERLPEDAAARSRFRGPFPPHDVLLGLLDGDQDFVAVSASSARLMRWEPKP